MLSLLLLVILLSFFFLKIGWIVITSLRLLCLSFVMATDRTQLTKCRRSDDKLFNMLLPGNIEQLKPEDFKDHFTNRHICYTNAKRKELNHRMMAITCKMKRHLKPLELNYDNNSQDVKLVAGTPIIARVNDKSTDICNNETFIIKEIHHKDEFLVVEDDGSDRLMEVALKDFQRLFHPTFAITIHKSQGQTFNHPYSIYEWNNKNFDNRLKYVALSRSTNIEHINVIA